MLQRRCYGDGKVVSILHTLRVTQASPGRWDAGYWILVTGCWRSAPKDLAAYAEATSCQGALGAVR